MPPTRLEALWDALPFERADSRPDEELLARFLDSGDQAAFEALLARHTPGVRAACRGWLRSPADIDDASQATFLVLVQRAGSIRDRARVGRWLYGVAANVARRLQRRRRSYPLPEDVPGREPPPFDDLDDLVAKEVARLPEQYRLAVQLCYWAGLSTAEAARRLGWPKGTVLTRLAWARKRLEQRLRREGVDQASLPALAATAVPAAGKPWLAATARAAVRVLAGDSPALAGVSQRTIALTEGVVRAMTWNRLKFVVLAALLAVGGIGFGLHLWASASDGGGKGRGARAGEADGQAAGKVAHQDTDKEAGKAPAAEGKAQGRPARRREVVIRLPMGSYVKEVDAATYGSGRLTWTYEEDRVLGRIEASVMGFEVELTTEAEYSLSSNGTIYGLITNVQLEHLKLPEGKEFAELKPFVKLWAAAEPLVNEVTSDLPFSYRFRVQGDRLIISNFRILLAGPNPLGKVGGLVAAKEVFAALIPFQALGTALEGTYTAQDKEKPAAKRLFLKPRGRPDQKKPRD
jgi:RNA polymerase sigma factor (sigma-70 family)